MNAPPPLSPAPPPGDGFPSRRTALVLWAALLVPTLAPLGLSPVHRTQEARVLEAAREMYEDPGTWLIPQLNGQVRLRKPPLAYWLSALSYCVFGVSEWAGRLPMALAGWLTVGVTCACGMWLLGRRAAFVGAAALASGYLFVSHAHLAETDVLATLFVTAAAYALWRGMAGVNPAYGPARPRRNDDSPGPTNWRFCARWFASAGVSLGLAVLSKGPPAAFALLFAGALLAVVRRNLRAIAAWMALACAIGAIIGAPWFVYVASQPQGAVIAEELRIAAEGQDHYQAPWYYLPYILAALLPWAGFLVMGIAAAVQDRWRDRSSARLALWAGAVLLPLLTVGNKQPHYLLPLLPPLALLVGWIVDLALLDAGQLARAGRGVFLGTLIAAAIAAPALVVGAAIARPGVLPTDFLAGAAVLGAAGWTAHRWLRRGLSEGILAFAVAAALLFPALLSGWAPTLAATNVRTVARDIRQRAGEGPYCFYGQRDALPFCFELRTVIPVYDTPAKLLAAAARDQRLVVITQEGKQDNVPPPLPPGFVERVTVRMPGYTLRAYRR